MRRGLAILLVAVLVGVACAASRFDCAEPPDEPGDRRDNKDVLSVATLNAEFLFLNASRCPGAACTWHTALEAYEHLRQVAAVLAQLNADVVNLAEVQDCAVLDTLIDVLHEEHGVRGYRGYLVPGTDTATQQNVALLTRVDPVRPLERTDARAAIPVPDSHCGWNPTYNSSTGVSKHYFTKLEIADSEGESTPVWLFGLHLKAFPLDPPSCAQREGQAAVIAGLMRERCDKHACIVLGDLNDYDSAVDALNTLGPTSRVLHMLRAPGADIRLESAADFVASVPARYSAWWDKNEDCFIENSELTLIDHLLFSRLAVRSAEFLHTYNKSCASPLPSDHWPLAISFQLLEAQPPLAAGWTLLVLALIAVLVGGTVGLHLLFPRALCH